jgi:hypothetical protein
MSENSDNINGWKSVFANYTISDVLKDCKYPILLSLFLTIIVIINSSTEIYPVNLSTNSPHPAYFCR